MINDYGDKKFIILQTTKCFYMKINESFQYKRIIIIIKNTDNEVI
jgi:hypothetical protein